MQTEIVANVQARLGAMMLNSNQPVCTLTKDDVRAIMLYKTARAVEKVAESKRYKKFQK